MKTRYPELLKLCKERFWKRKSIIWHHCATCERWGEGYVNLTAISGCKTCAYYYELDYLQCPACIIAEYRCGKCLVSEECNEANEKYGDMIDWDRWEVVV